MFVTDPNKNFWERTWQLTSRFTWEGIQTTVGYYYTQGRNIGGNVDRVDYFGGATWATKENSSRGGVSLGNYINMKIEGEISGSFEDWVLSDPWFMHEYGHYLQLSQFGHMSWYNMAFSSITTPKGSHRENCTEQDANYRAMRYFRNKITPDQLNNFLTDPYYSGYFNSYGYRLWLGYIMPFELFTNLFWRY